MSSLDEAWIATPRKLANPKPPSLSVPLDIAASAALASVAPDVAVLEPPSTASVLFVIERT